jgi:hypothetical protein
MRMQTTSFEQIPVALVKKLAEKEVALQSSCFIPCAICGKPVDLELCKTNETGNAVHGKCYVGKMTQTQKNGTDKMIAR